MQARLLLENNMLFRVGGAVVLAVAILSGCGKRETDAGDRKP